MKTPEQIKPHAPKYKKNSWQTYTPGELGEWVHLLLKRAHNRESTNQDGIRKDLTDAANYLAMLGEHVKSAQESLIVTTGEQVITSE